MGKRWRKYQVGQYRLGQLLGEGVVVWKDKAGKHRRRLGVHTEVEGRAALDAWVRRVAIQRADTAQTVGDLFALYVENRERDGKLIRAFHDNWKALKTRFGALPVDAITEDICRDYTRARLAQGRSAGTIWTELTRLRSCLNWALKRRVIKSVPYVWIPSKPEPKDRVLEVDEVLRLIDGCVMPHVRLFVILAITTGARSAAICELTWDRVDFDRGVIDYRLKEIINPLTKKARKQRAHVAMTEEARAALTTAKAGALTDHVIEWEGKPIRKIRKGFMAAVERAGLGEYVDDPEHPGKKIFVTDVTPHVLRHTISTWLEEEGMAIEDISRLVGHRDVATTRKIYSHPKAESLRPIAKVIDMKLRRQSTSAEVLRGSLDRKARNKK